MAILQSLHQLTGDGVYVFHGHRSASRPMSENNEVPIGRRSIIFMHVRPKALAGLNGKNALVVQALRHLGKGNVGQNGIDALRAKLSLPERNKLVDGTRFGVDWTYEVAKKIAVAA